jgi:acetoin utilization deacetylase AcuC-like enzyme
MPAASYLSALPVFYSDKMIGQVASFSPSAAKPKAVLESWLALGIPLDLRDVEPVTNAQLALAHDPAYIEGIFAGTVINGFKTKDPQLAETCRYTVGAMLAAAHETLRNKAVAIAPVSGFHHATYDEAFGFCTFNGLIVTARVLKAAGLVKLIGILDCVVHYGDGTHALITHFGLQDWLQHYTLGFQSYATPECADKFLSSLPAVIDGMRDCDLILYQAGADPHINDPLGGFMTTAQLQYRDELVFLLCQQYGIPIAWNLAGGYQRDADGGIRPVLEIHDNTLMACRVFLTLNAI